MDVSPLVGAEASFSTVKSLHLATQVSEARRTFNQQFPEGGREKDASAGWMAWAMRFRSEKFEADDSLYVVRRRKNKDTG